jgi:hypothetical protein
VLWRKFDLTVTTNGAGHGHFFLVVSFGRCKFLLSEDLVAHIFRLATLGGVATNFNVSLLDHHVFKFFVS